MVKNQKKCHYIIFKVEFLTALNDFMSLLISSITFGIQFELRDTENN
jgi:hypothetical protein